MTGENPVRVDSGAESETLQAVWADTAMKERARPLSADVEGRMQPVWQLELDALRDRLAALTAERDAAANELVVATRELRETREALDVTRRDLAAAQMQARLVETRWTASAATSAAVAAERDARISELEAAVAVGYWRVKSKWLPRGQTPAMPAPAHRMSATIYMADMEPIEDTHPVTWLRGKRVFGLAVDELPSPTLIGPQPWSVVMTPLSVNRPVP